MNEFMTYAPFVWLIILILFVVVEAVTVQMVAIWFVVGALASLVTSLLGGGFDVQVIVFLAVSILLLIFTRKIVVDLLKVRQTKTNADSNVGKVATVIAEVNPLDNTGRVLLSGQDWAARSECSDNIEVGEKVVIKEITGVTFIVDRIV